MALSLRSCKTEWRLHRYARFFHSNDKVQSENVSSSGKNKAGVSRQEGTWKISSWSDDEPLILSIQDSSHLLLTKGKLILESQPLFDANRYLRGAYKGDCLLFMQRIKNECRKFRVKFHQSTFSSSLEACENCVSGLQKFFQVRKEETTSTTNQVPLPSRTTLEGEVPLGSVAKVFLEREAVDLPLAYQHHQSSWEPHQLSEGVRLCLSDPTFPAFVEQVENELKKISSED